MILQRFYMQDYGDKLTKSKRGRIDYRASILTERFLTMVLKVISNPKFLYSGQRFFEWKLL